ncbi:hypothetical protein JTE90_024230 [Oedothorax gibbosus]|uniref:Integrase catalytic domain-containing protein n=1 Tax=Oedothorax gibbosus TaxID=931172 RepID=A0AAV6TP01_9ARAC|nr:hypothetical protein JTE90_024230 [Oedothorax gibbosus]
MTRFENELDILPSAVGVPVALPKDRVNDSNVFQTTGIDLAGPLFLLNGEEVWIVLYTCAVFRAIHLELVPSLSTASFLLSLRRFIARRGRPKTIYTDNLTNFRGAVNEFQNLDWSKIEQETELQGLKWKLSLPQLRGGMDGGRAFSVLSRTS